MNDYRLEWMKDIVYRFLSIDQNDRAFEELLERDDVSLKTLDTLFSNSKETQRCIFFYFIIVEKEIEKQDILEELLESHEPSKAESSESSKIESDEILDSDIADEKIHFVFVPPTDFAINLAASSSFVKSFKVVCF
ncbi:uncharacterized protein LOC118190516 [Stegodyphus dumicola]|uniref:uncharacterized protein LOC118190516 n=1 Tax=Stegodyphus dumicola TaxID=202533 RepID=UPI0015ACC432|nr:uncharacterized protein LOC118190516 [Stegodyphus dumicola]